MWTGRQTLGSIEDAVAKLQSQEGRLDQALRSAVSDAERLRTERGQALRELARIKLDEMAAGRLIANLDTGERRASQILDDYRLRIAAVADQCEALRKEVTSAQADRHAAAATVEGALDAVDRLRAEAEAKVQATQDWHKAKEVRDKADDVAAESEKKADASAAELSVKKKPYDEDPLFAYLWRRHFGTAHYVGGNVSRMIDRLVAEFIGYDNARLNYATLIEIPLRLKEHATTQGKAAEETRAALAKIERDAMLQAGVDAQERVLAEARHKLASIDDTVEKKRDMLRKLDEARVELLAGNSNPAYNDALTTIAANDAEDSIANLYAEARRTSTSADEAVVGRIETINGKLAETEKEISNLRRGAIDLSRRRSEMEGVREKFRRTGYDHPQSTFNNGGDIGSILGGVLEGAVRSGVLWDLLRQGHGSRPIRGGTDFGGASFPFPFPLPGGRPLDGTGDGWRNNPSSRGGWLPAPPDNDQFTTGGSF